MEARPTRPLPACCVWRFDDAGGAYLDWHAGCVGYVVPEGTGYRTVIQWRQRVHEGRAGSRKQGMRFIERWIEKRKGGLPGGGKPRWYDHIQRPRL